MRKIWNDRNLQKKINCRALREKCPNTNLFLVRMRENTDQKKPRIWTLFTQWGGGGIIFDLVRKLFELSLLKITDESVAKQEKFQILFEEFVTA